MTLPNRALCFATAILLPLIGSAGEVRDDVFRAVRNDDLAFLRAHKTGLDVRDSRGATALMHAAAFGSSEALKWLIDAGADVNAKNAFDATGLMWAAGDAVKVRMLIEHGANVGIQSKQGRTPLMIAAQRPGSTENVRLMLAKGADPRVKDGRGDTALRLAAEAGNVEVVRLLLDKGAEVDALNFRSETPLMSAAAAGSLDAVRLLLAKGANVNAATTFYAIVKNGPIPLTQLTALQNAASYGSPELIAALLRAGANVNAQDARGMTPLMLAVASEKQDVKVVRLLLKAGAGVNLKSGFGETALDWAAKFGNRSVIAMLREAGAKEGSPRPAPARLESASRQDPAASLQKSIALLQRSSTEFFNKSGCVGCHHQPLTAMAVRAARGSGIAVDETAARAQLNMMKLQWASSQEEFLQGIDPGGAADRLTYSLLGLWDAGYAADVITDSAVAEVAAWQRPNGSWSGESGHARAPLQDSDISRTARALRVLQVYGSPGRKAEFTRRVTLARDWLLESKAVTADEQAMVLFGLWWSGASHEHVQRAARVLISQQREDGGWAGNANLASDAFSTGESLAALHETGSAKAGDAPYQRGVKYLLRTQCEDGSWYVSSRAVKFQPYFQSGFPFDHDQWISVAATAWASVAIAPTIGPAVAGR